MIRSNRYLVVPIPTEIDTFIKSYFGQYYNKFNFLFEDKSDSVEYYYTLFVDFELAPYSTISLSFKAKDLSESYTIFNKHLQKSFDQKDIQARLAYVLYLIDDLTTVLN